MSEDALLIILLSISGTLMMKSVGNKKLREQLQHQDCIEDIAVE